MFQQEFDKDISKTRLRASNRAAAKNCCALLTGECMLEDTIKHSSCAEEEYIHFKNIQYQLSLLSAIDCSVSTANSIGWCPDRRGCSWEFL